MSELDSADRPPPPDPADASPAEDVETAHGDTQDTADTPRYDPTADLDPPPAEAPEPADAGGPETPQPDQGTKSPDVDAETTEANAAGPEIHDPLDALDEAPTDDPAEPVDTDARYDPLDAMDPPDDGTSQHPTEDTDTTIGDQATDEAYQGDPAPQTDEPTATPDASEAAEASRDDATPHSDQAPPDETAVADSATGDTTSEASDDIGDHNQEPSEPTDGDPPDTDPSALDAEQSESPDPSAEDHPESDREPSDPDEVDDRGEQPAGQVVPDTTESDHSDDLNDDEPALDNTQITSTEVDVEYSPSLDTRDPPRVDGSESDESGWDDSPRSQDAAQLLPVDDSGRQLTPQDCRFLGIEPSQVEWWSERTAPLGMTPETFTELRSSLFDALRADGFEPSQVDVRLQGSSARFFSGEHKELPTREELTDYPEAASHMDEWLGQDLEPPLRRPFDSMYQLGLDEPSDYDIQISSDAMVDQASRVADDQFPDDQFPDESVFHPKYHFIMKDIVREAFPNLREWRKEWKASLGRDVAPAVFAGSGPPDTSSSHFRNDDWMIKP